MSEAVHVSGPETFHELQALAAEWGIEIPLKAPFEPLDVDRVLPLLRLPLPDRAKKIQMAADSGLDYNIVSYSYQAHVDRMNWVLGATNWKWVIRDQEFDDQDRTSLGAVKFRSTGVIDLLIGYPYMNEKDYRYEWITVHQVPPMPTDHESTIRGDAEKGMITKGIKRATSILGVGADAYLGALDEDLLTGVQQGDRLAGPRGEDLLPWEERRISQRDQDILLKLATARGFDKQALQRWYATATSEAITVDVKDLNNEQLGIVKRLLVNVPEKIVESTPEPPEKPFEDNSIQEPPKDQQEQTVQESDGNLIDIITEQTEIKDPESLDQLMSWSDDDIRELAARFTVTAPLEFNKNNRIRFCKMLASICIPQKEEN